MECNAEKEMEHLFSSEHFRIAVDSGIEQCYAAIDLESSEDAIENHYINLIKEN